MKEYRAYFRKLAAALVALTLVLGCLPMQAPFAAYADGPDGPPSLTANAAGKDIDADLTIFFTNDIHDFYGNAARLSTLLKENSSDHSIYVDGGDIAMGTLYQAAFSTDAIELRALGRLGCEVMTFGNHEYDYGTDGMTKMLRAAMASGDPLPHIVQSNIDFSGELTPSQQAMKDAYDDYGITSTLILEKDGLKLGFFGLEGIDSIECVQTDLNWINYIEAAKTASAELEAQGCDIIIALSHSGTSGGGQSGEDIELAKAVPAIDVIISAHSHTAIPEAVIIGDTILGSTGCYLENLGRMDLKMGESGPKLVNYELIPVTEDIPEDPEMAEIFAGYKKQIEAGYLAKEGVAFDQVIAYSSFDMISLGEMYRTHQEYTTGDLIADSYIYEARRNGIDDIDVALVGLGTIRGSIEKGYITVADAFEICSLGVGSDSSAGHPLLAAYITGKELKLLTELDASLGPSVSSIKMSYSGLSYRFNTKRILLDRVTSVRLVRDGIVFEDGTYQDPYYEEIDDKKLYKVCCNMYAANMLGMLNGLTKGVLSITPKNADGTPIEDFYSVALKNYDGDEIKEWIAFKNYLMSFPARGQVSQAAHVPDFLSSYYDPTPSIPLCYSEPMGRKTAYEQGGLAVISHPGTATKLIPHVILGAVCLIALIILAVVFGIRRLKRRVSKLR